LHIYLGVLTICFLSSLISFRLDFPLYLKLLSALIGVCWVTECFSILVMPQLKLGNNMPMYNVYLLIETMGYGIYFYLLLKTPWIKRGIALFSMLFPLAWFYTTFYVFGFTHWNSYGLIMETCFVVAMCITYLYEIFTAEDMISLHNSPEFWIAAGLLIFFACTLPFCGMLNFLDIHEFTLALKFLEEFQILNILLYTIFIYAFLCRIITRN
jgi:hypothetical protein